jgi:hypothetical protein
MTDISSILETLKNLDINKEDSEKIEKIFTEEKTNKPITKDMVQTAKTTKTKEKKEKTDSEPKKRQKRQKRDVYIRKIEGKEYRIGDKNG